MNAESLQMVLSVLSAVVAVFSAIVAYRTRRQSRQDIFETQRDLLLLSISENDIRLKTLEFKASLLQTRLSQAASREEGDASHARALIEGLGGIAQLARSLRARDWTEEQVRSTHYSEASLLELRKRTLEEQVTGKTLQAEAHSVLFDEAQTELSKRASATP
jgi:hypothetical protein